MVRLLVRGLSPGVERGQLARLPWLEISVMIWVSLLLNAVLLRLVAQVDMDLQAVMDRPVVTDLLVVILRFIRLVRGLDLRRTLTGLLVMITGLQLAILPGLERARLPGLWSGHQALRKGPNILELGRGLPVMCSLWLQLLEQWVRQPPGLLGP